jgi:membrane associated rhomboid family serine protease
MSRTYATSVNTIGGGGTGNQIITTSGTIDDSNVTFPFSSVPSLLDINGLLYRQSGGAITWTISGTTLTLSSPVGSNGTIFGITGVYTIIETPGTIDDSNMSFTSTVQPYYLIFNGATYPQSDATITWTYLLGSMTISSPIGANGSLFGLSGISLVVDTNGITTGIL